MQSEWSACPPDVLQRCMDAQVDQNDNAAAACVSKLWRDTFRRGGHAINLTYSPLRPLPAASYLQQFSHLTSVTLCRPVWEAQKSWLATPATQGHQYAAAAVWAGICDQLPPACSNVTVINCLPRASASNSLHTSTLVQPLSQLTNLRHLNLQYPRGADILTEMLSGQTHLETLQVSGSLLGGTLHFVGSLGALPSSITKLQLSGFEHLHDDTALVIEHLMHLQQLKDLDLTNSTADMHGLLGGLVMLTRLILGGPVTHVSLLDDIFPLTALQVLSLRDTNYSVFPELGHLSDLLSHLGCLQELDVMGCSLLAISPADCKHLKLSSFSFDYEQLDNPDQSLFQHFVLDDSAPAKPSKLFLRMDDRLASYVAVSFLAFGALTHLSIRGVQEWPDLFVGWNDMGLLQLRVLDIQFAAASDAKDKMVWLNTKLRLTDLYIAGSDCHSYDFAQCTTLCSLNIIHKASSKPALTLPPFLTRLCLHNTLSASTDPRVHNVDNLVSVKLGGRAAGKDTTRQLPSLPRSTVELDLWDGLLTDLQQLTRLTNLKKLCMPDPPTEQQLHVIRQLHQLRWLDVTGREGMHSREGRIIPPWIDQWHAHAF